VAGVKKGERKREGGKAKMANRPHPEEGEFTGGVLEFLEEDD